MNSYKILISAPYMQMEFDRFKKIFKQNNWDYFLPKVEERLEESELKILNLLFIDCWSLLRRKLMLLFVIRI